MPHPYSETAASEETTANILWRSGSPDLPADCVMLPRPAVGGIVRIPRGVAVTSGNPQRPFYTSGRNQSVTVADSWQDDGRVFIAWEGMGGYVCHTSGWEWTPETPSSGPYWLVSDHHSNPTPDSRMFAPERVDTRLSYSEVEGQVEYLNPVVGDYTDYNEHWRYCQSCLRTFYNSVAIDRCPECSRCCCRECMPGSRWHDEHPHLAVAHSEPGRREPSPRDYLHSYDFRPDRFWFWTGDGTRKRTPRASKAYFGVELEMECPDTSTVRRVVEMTEDVDDRKWWTKYDGSLGRYGVELVSHPATLKAHYEVMDWENLLSEFTSMGCRSWDTDTCGLHVHISRDSLPESGWWRVGRLLHSNPRAVARVVGRSGSRYAQWNMEQINSAIFNKAELYTLDRYQAMNLANEKTVEFRVFRGSLVPGTLFAAIEMVAAMRDYCQQLTFSQVQSGGLEWGQFTRWVRVGGTYGNLIERLSRMAVARNPDDPQDATALPGLSFAREGGDDGASPSWSLHSFTAPRTEDIDVAPIRRRARRRVT